MFLKRFARRLLEEDARGSLATRASLPSTSGSGFRGRLTPQPAQRLIPSSPSCSSAGVEETRASPKSTQAKGGGVLAAGGGIRSRKCNIGLGTLQPFGLSNGILEAAEAAGRAAAPGQPGVERSALQLFWTEEPKALPSPFTGKGVWQPFHSTLARLQQPFVLL